MALVFLGALLLTSGGGGRQAVVGAGGGTSRSALVGLLSVLRQPQTPAGAAFEHVGWPTPGRAPGSRIEPDRSLIRLASVAPWGAKVFIVPFTSPTNRVLRRDLGETAALWVQGIGWSDYASVPAIRAGNAWGPEATVDGPHGLQSRFFEIVPDGVAKVVFYRLRHSPRPGRAPEFSGSVTAHVHENVAVFEVKTNCDCAYPVYAAWYTAAGRLIKRIGNWTTPTAVLQSFPLAPRTQQDGGAGGAGGCRLASPNPYLPSRSGCVTAAVADVDGDGQPDLVLSYAQLGNRRFDGGFLPTTFTLKVVRDGGRTLTTALPRFDGNPAILFVRSVNGRPGAQIFIQDGCISSGCSVDVYTVAGSAVRRAGAFTYGGDSGAQFGLTCRRGKPPAIIQHQFLLQSGGANALWKQTDSVFVWIGATLKRMATITGLRHESRDVGGLGFPPRSLTSVRC